MKKMLVKKSIYAGSYIFLAIVIEIITFVTMGIGVVPTHFGLDIAVILIISFIIFILPHSVAQLILVLLMLGLQFVLSIVNISLYSMSGTVFSFGMLNLINEVTGVVDASFLNWWFIAGLGLLYIGSGVGLLVLTAKYRVEKGLYVRNVVIIMLAAFLVVECFAGLMYSGIVQSFSASAETEDEYGFDIFYDEDSLYYEQTFRAKAFREFGTFGYFVVNIVNSISSDTYVDDITVDEIDEYFASGEMSSSVYGDNIYTGTISGKNVVLIVIESGEWYVINKEYTPTLYAMAEQGIHATNFHARDKTNVSEALSIMGSYPSITELEPAEVVGNSMTYTLPNIVKEDEYKYTTNYFHINYGEYYSRSSTFGELYGFDNLYFIEDLDKLDGNTNKTGFYDMDKDSEVFRYYADELTYSDGDGPFYTQMMTLTTHGRYTDLVNYGNYPFATTPSAKGEVSTGDMSEEEKAEFSENCDVKGLEDYYALIDSFPSTYVSGTQGVDEDYLEELDVYSDMFLRYKRYQAGMMDLDYGVNMLVQNLKESDELDDTVFVFYADHSAYYHQMNFIMKGIDTSETYNTDVYNVPFFMWYGGSMDLTVDALSLDGYASINFEATEDTDSGLQSGTIDKFTCTLDILPTMLHLMGYSYNMNLYQGVSMFSDVQRVFISHESGIFNDYIFFDTIYIYRKEDEVWVKYDFESTYKSGGFGGEEYEDIINFLIEARDSYAREEMLDAVVLNDYFASRSISDGYVTQDGTTVKYLEKIVKIPS